jgi:hypothetical protein
MLRFGYLTLLKSPNESLYNNRICYPTPREYYASVAGIIFTGLGCLKEKNNAEGLRLVVRDEQRRYTE